MRTDKNNRTEIEKQRAIEIIAGWCGVHGIKQEWYIELVEMIKKGDWIEKRE